MNRLSFGDESLAADRLQRVMSAIICSTGQSAGLNRQPIR